MKQKFVRQVGPLCGFYSLYNGLVYLKGIKTSDVYSNVLAALQQFTEKNLAGVHTEIGEFFDIDEYLLFIKNNKFNKKFFSQQFEATKMTLKDGISKINGSKDCFIIVPTNPKPYGGCGTPKKGKDVLDWITVYPIFRNFFLVLNPDRFVRVGVYGWNTEKGILEQNNKLKNKSFTWQQYPHITPEKARDGKDKQGFKKSIRIEVDSKWKGKSSFLLSQSKIGYNKNVGQCILIKTKDSKINC